MLRWALLLPVEGRIAAGVQGLELHDVVFRQVVPLPRSRSGRHFALFTFIYTRYTEWHVEFWLKYEF